MSEHKSGETDWDLRWFIIGISKGIEAWRDLIHFVTFVSGGVYTTCSTHKSSRLHFVICHRSGTYIETMDCNGHHDTVALHDTILLRISHVSVSYSLSTYCLRFFTSSHLYIHYSPNWLHLSPFGHISTNLTRQQQAQGEEQTYKRDPDKMKHFLQYIRTFKPDRLILNMFIVCQTPEFLYMLQIRIFIISF